MILNDYRKKFFLNSQYCTFFNISNSTVLVGILRNIGYRYSAVLPDEKLKHINKNYRKFNALLNSLIALEIIAYIYFVVFPYYIQLMKFPYYAVILLLSLIPIAALYLTYWGVNLIYEKYLTKYVGTFQKIKFKPDIKNVDEKAFREYLKTPKTSVYFAAVLTVIFCGYVLTPFIIKNLSNAKKFNDVIKISDIYLTLVPIASDIYAQRAYAEYNLKQYKEAVFDYEKANEYSLSDNFSNDILGVKTYFLPFKDMVAEFDKAINNEKEKPIKYLLISEKAAYLLKNNDYKSAYSILDKLVKIYDKREKVYFSPAVVHYNRGKARLALGDKSGAEFDFRIARNMCPECKFNYETRLIQKP